MWEAKKPLLLEIYQNPEDLAVVITEDPETHMFGFWVSRGPDLKYKIILTYLPFTLALEKVLEVAKFLFERALNAGSQEQVGDTGKVLNRELIDTILDKLRKHREVSTF